jgi:RecA/RadA recombinase
LRLVEDKAVDKSKALDAALSQIERAFGKGSIMRLGANEQVVEIETVPTGSLGLDIALGVGGLPRGRIVEIYGPESSGKTTLALHTVAEAQKKGGICAFVDAEHALDPVYARKLGVERSRNTAEMSVMPASAIACATLSAPESPPRTDSSEAETPRCTALRNALKTPPPTSSRIRPGLEAAGTYGPETWPRRSICAPPIARM